MYTADEEELGEKPKRINGIVIDHEGQTPTDEESNYIPETEDERDEEFDVPIPTVCGNKSYAVVRRAVIGQQKGLL